jgi:multidrug efflux pump subunit AcrB
MREVSGPIIAITLVLCAVFVPMAFLEGVTGEFYRQFAVTIAMATVISGFNSLTLSPALAAVLLQAARRAEGPADAAHRPLLGWLFRPFNRFFGASSERYQASVTRSLCGAARCSWSTPAARRHRADVPGGARRLHPDAGQAVPDRRASSCPRARRWTAPRRW